MRVLIDYRAALRQRSGVGEYTHQLARALLKRRALGCTDETSPDVTLFSSSWKDRLVPEPGLEMAGIIDRRVPVAVLNLAWHRLAWPTAETVCGRGFDVLHSLHPLLMPSRKSARVVTIHDLNFLAHPERTRAEIRRDYPRLARQHALRADRVVAVSQFTAGEAERLLGVPPDRVSICSPGAPDWPQREAVPANGYVLFFGTLEPRKNVTGLLDAYQRLSARRRDLPQLVLAGQATPESGPWLARIARPPLQNLVRHIGYVPPNERRRLYEGASLLVVPSFDEGFGLPVLEAMTTGVPVIAANRGALPEVLDGAGLLVDPLEPDDIASAIERLIDDQALAASAAEKGLARAKAFTWDETARHTISAYEAAITRRARRPGID